MEFGVWDFQILYPISRNTLYNDAFSSILKTMVRKLFLTIAISLMLPHFAQAQETSLGNFSIDEIQKIVGSPVFFHIKDQKVAVDKNALMGLIKIRPALKFSPAYNSEAENINFYPTSRPIEKIYYQLLEREQDRYHIKISTSLSLDEAKLKDSLNKIKEDTRVNPTDAKFSFSDGKAAAFALSSDGYEVNSDESFSAIVKSFSENPYAKDITLAITPLKPSVSSSSIDQYGIKELIGEGISNFRGSPTNRIHNVTVGANKFNGVLIKPGEEFSFIKTLGPVDKSTGYLPELVIKEDKTIPEYGGGMCQVSTTMFRAALNAGLKITARTNHAYPVQYYAPQGTDATVYIPNPDLKFLNDTENYILVQTRIEGTQLFFDFYGTSDGREAKLVGPFVTERGEGGAMKTILTQEVYDKDGNLVRKAEFKSKYDSPSKYPHPGEQKITEKPSDWSNKEWKAYKKANGL
jgi:vancomycin resistance protein YoaR